MARNSRRILVADDDPIYRGVAQETLELAGHEVTTAADGGEAMALLARKAFDAAIIDLTMPVADGIAVIETLRGGSRNATIPVVVITGHDDAQAVERAYLAGATSFLTKPLNWLLFTPHIEFVLRSGQIEDELREASATSAFLSDLKSQVMQALAQEFQTPIKTIFGFSELIQKEVYGPLQVPAYKDMMADISKSARSLNAALLKVMNFGRTLTQNLDMKCAAVKAREAVLDAIASVEQLAQRREIQIDVQCSIADDVSLFADQALLSQALHGVVENAIRLSSRGAHVSVRAETSPDGGLVVSVTDEGPAHPQDLLREINGQLNAIPVYANQPQSNGVSIKIAKVLAEAHNGHLTLKSDTMSGNLVRLTFPRGGMAAIPTATSQPAIADVPARLAQISAELSSSAQLKDRLAFNASPSRAPDFKLNRTGGAQ
jgi:CheY-like chemotaxis protein